jgi:DNA mismatch repair protein MutS2
MIDTSHEARRIDPFSREVLEFSDIVGLLKSFLSGPLAEPLLVSLAPKTDLNEIRRDLERVREALEWLGSSPRPSLGSLRDPRAILEKLHIEGVSLAGLEILALLGIARAALDLRGFFQKTPFARLDELLSGLADFRSLVAELDGKILPDGSVDSSASAELARLRRAIERLRQETESTLQRLLQRLSRDQVVQESVVTIRNDRLVIPIRVEEKRRVAGVVHGTSSSGQTVYVEPLETVPLNNELVELQDREFAEVQRILGTFSAKLRARHEDFAAATEILSTLDLVYAKGQFAREYQCTIPELGPERALLLKDIRHPLLEKTLRSRHQHPVPLTIELKEPKTLVVVSGPNTGGKTVALKTIGIAVLMAQAGLPVAAQEVRLPLFGRVLADIGDQQSMAANLSTFSAHVTNIQSMVEVAGGNDLVLLDELGASTEPGEGAALAIAILDHFRRLGTMTFVTTHHSRLKAYGTDNPEAVNAAMEFDEATLQPTYRLLVGLPGKSNALDIAERLNLAQPIVERARALLDRAESEAARLIVKLHEQKAQLDREVQGLEAQRQELKAREAELRREFERERRSKLQELDARLAETLTHYERKWESVLAELRAEMQAESSASKAAKKGGQKGATFKRQAREEWDAQVLETLGAPASQAEPVVPKPPAVGDLVRVAALSTPGTVTALVDDDHLEIEVGRLRMRVRKDEVRVLPREKPSGQSSRSMLHAPADVPAEINVIGRTAEEARALVDKFLDQAYVARRFRLRIVHGHGKGILKKSLQEMFSSHPHVEKFYAAPPEEGGTGATIVELKL